MQNALPILILAGPAALLLAFGVSRADDGLRPAAAKLAATLASLAALIAGAAACAGLAIYGAQSWVPGEGILQLLSIRLDAVSVTMLMLVSFIGAVVIRYSATYLDGEARQGKFTGWLCVTLAAVMVLVVAGNLLQLTAAWVAMSLCLHKLLLFYPDRVQSVRAARKKFIIARAGDAALIGAAAVLYAGYGTADIGAILEAARNGSVPAWASLAAALIALAAILKSAQFPAHGWLTEVMEAPTPVSALLHAGVINAGGFLLIRFADVMLLAPGVLAVLVMLGGFTALLGGLAMLAQPAVKTSLAWSTIAQMGFMILQCGWRCSPWRCCT